MRESQTAIIQNILVEDIETEFFDLQSGNFPQPFVIKIETGEIPHVLFGNLVVFEVFETTIGNVI